MQFLTRYSQRLLWGFMVLCIVLASSRTTYATPSEELELARESFRAGEFEGAIGKFSALLYPTSRLAEASSIAEAHLLLGVCFFETGNNNSAKREFEEALFLDENLSLSANLFSKNAIVFFNQIASDQKEDSKNAAERARLARKREALNRAVQNSIVFEKSRYWVNFMPLGAGQFQNGQTRKAISFFVAEAITGGAAVGIWSYQVVKYGFGGNVPRDEVDTVNTLQIIQIGSGAAFWAIHIWGVIDSLSNYEHTVKRALDPEIKKSLEEILKNETTSSLILAPIIGPDMRGAALSWEF